MSKVEQLKQAIENAEHLKSKLTEEVIAIGGFTSNKIRHLLNNLGALSTNVFEIGSHRGSTLCATIYGNENIEYVTCVDNFSEFNDDGSPEHDLLSNLKSFSPTEKYMLLKRDCFGITELPFGKPDLYCYDGLHADWAQKQALTYFYDMLPNEFIFCVDDYQWEQVKKGTQDGIKECGLEILFEEELGMNTPSSGDEYWNGFYVSLLKKK